jgi:hypothetical protein
MGVGTINLQLYMKSSVYKINTDIAEITSLFTIRSVTTSKKLISSPFAYELEECEHKN